MILIDFNYLQLLDDREVEVILLNLAQRGTFSRQNW